MQSIETKYLGPTNTRGGRVKATASGGGGSVTLPWDHALDSYDMHYKAATALCLKMGWKGKLKGGSTKKGYVWMFI